MIFLLHLIRLLYVYRTENVRFKLPTVAFQAAHLPHLTAITFDAHLSTMSRPIGL